MPVAEISGLVLLAMVAIGNYVEAWKRTSTKWRAREAYNEMIMSCVQLQTLDGYFKSFNKYLRCLTKEESEEYKRLLEDGENWIGTVHPRSIQNVPLTRLEKQATEVKALVGIIEHFMEPYKKAVIGFSSEELIITFKYKLPFFETDFEKEKPWGTLQKRQDQSFRSDTMIAEKECAILC